MRAEWDNHPAHAYIAPGTTVFHRHSGKSCFYGHGVIDFHLAHLVDYGVCRSIQ